MKDLFLFRQKPTEEKKLWLRTCVQENESKLIRYVKNLVHNLEVSKDIVQDSFLKLWQQDHLKLKGHETPWLFTTNRNSAYDYLRRKKRNSSESQELLLSVADSSENSEEQLIKMSSEQILAQVLKSLTPAQREILDLKFQEGLSYKEISEITGHSVNQVGVLIHNIVSSIKEKVKAAESKGGRYENR